MFTSTCSPLTRYPSSSSIRFGTLDSPDTVSPQADIPLEEFPPSRLETEIGQESIFSISTFDTFAPESPQLAPELPQPLTTNRVNVMPPQQQKLGAKLRILLAGAGVVMLGSAAYAIAHIVNNPSVSIPTEGVDSGSVSPQSSAASLGARKAAAFREKSRFRDSGTEL